ncbi:MAG TPA: glutamate--tRNA ligase [bacterium]
MEPPFRTRFAPSPTGPPHLGMLRTALFAWLIAKKHDGKFILRIDDTDEERSMSTFLHDIVNVLHHLGLHWDEGPSKGGEFGPYRQSERGEIYREAIKKLKSGKFLYPCFCTESDLNLQRAAARASGRAFIYDGRCRKLSESERNTRIDSGDEHVWRFHVDSERLGDSVEFEDLVYGPQKFDTPLLGDFICIRGDGKPTYMLVSPLDDASMKISHIIRGADHIPNTPSQILLMKALGYDAPKFAHLPLIVSAGGKKLSKRDSLTGFQEAKKYLPIALVNHLALMGWSHPEAKEVLTPDELISSFDFDRISTSPSAHDKARLEHLEKEHIRMMSPEEILEAWKLSAWLVVFEDDLIDEIKNVIESVKDELVSLKDISDKVIPLTKRPDEDHLMKVFSNIDKNSAIVVLQTLSGSSHDIWHDKIEELAAEHGKRNTFTPLRLALTGEHKGFEIKKLIVSLPEEVMKKRLDAAIKVLQEKND